MSNLNLKFELNPIDNKKVYISCVVGWKLFKSENSHYIYYLNDIKSVENQDTDGDVILVSFNKSCIALYDQTKVLVLESSNLVLPSEADLLLESFFLASEGSFKFCIIIESSSV